MSGPLFSDDLDEPDDIGDLEDQLDDLLDSPTDFDEYIMNEDDCA